MSLGGIQQILASAQNGPPTTTGLLGGGGKGGAIPQQPQPQAYVQPNQQVGFYAPQLPSEMRNFNNSGNIVDQTLLQQQSILGRPMQQYQQQPYNYQSFYPDPVNTQPGAGLLIPDWRDMAAEMKAKEDAENSRNGIYYGGDGGYYGGDENIGFDPSSMSEFGGFGAGNAGDAGVSGANSESSHGEDGNNG